MAMKILASRVLQTSNNGGIPIRACLTAQMSSSSTPAVPPTKSKTPAPIKSEVKVKRESFRSKLSAIFGGPTDHYDSSKPPIPSNQIRLPDQVDYATGEEKLLLLAFEYGIIDPYCNLPVERRGRGTKDNPVVIESFFDHRIVACVCEPKVNSHRFTYVYKGEPKRCRCGHWLEVVDAPRFWEKIPKDELVEISFFRTLEERGKLDKFLETGKLDKEEEHLTIN